MKSGIKYVKMILKIINSDRRIIMLNKITAAVTAALLLCSVLCFSGCGEGNSEKAQSSDATADELNIYNLPTEATYLPVEFELGEKAKFFDLSYSEPKDYESVEDMDVTEDIEPYTVRGYSCAGFMLTLTYVKDSKVETWVDDDSDYSEENIDSHEFKMLTVENSCSAFTQHGSDVYTLRCIDSGGIGFDRMSEIFSEFLHSIKFK